MAIAYSQELRKKALYLMAVGEPISRINRELDISRPTLYKWKEKWEKTGSTQPQKNSPPPQPAKIVDWERFQQFVEQHKDKTQKEMAKLWGNCSHHTISRGLKKIGYTRKKKTIAYLERCPIARDEFREEIAKYSPEQVIYIDESGIDNNETNPYGWSKKGERCQGNRPGKRGERLSIIGALCNQKFFAPMVYQGYCTAQVIETWLEKFLLPQVTQGQVIVMDNAPFHNSRKIRELIEQAGCKLLFLPTYSPDLNPIEHW